MFSRLKQVNRIILSAGHGGSEEESFEPGELFDDFLENTEVKQIISRLVPRLTANGFTVIVTPDYGLHRTIAHLNANYDSTTDLALQIHKDSTDRFKARNMYRRTGIYFHPLATEGREIAEELEKHFKLNGAHKTSWSRPDSASPHKKLPWIRQPKMLSFVIECGFYQDKKQEEEDEFYATIIAKSLCRVFGKSYFEKTGNLFQ